MHLTQHRRVIALRTLVALCFVVLFAGCASAPNVGVRTGFENRTLPRVALAPVSSTSRFGTAAAQWRQLERDVLSTMTSELEALGFEVIDAEQLRDELERKQAWARFTELLDFSNGLDQRFEPSLYSPPTAEVLTLRELALDGVMPAPAVVFTELVYQSAGTCSVDPRKHSQFAIVVDRRGEPVEADGPSDCVVTHVQAKLVDVNSASTMWHNRVLRELRMPRVEPSDERANVTATARSVVAGEYGLAPFVPNASAKAAIAGQ